MWQTVPFEGTISNQYMTLKTHDRWPARYEGMAFRAYNHVPIIREDSNVNRWSAATFAWPKLLSTAAFSQYHKFNTKLALDMIFPAMRYLKFTNLHDLKNVNMRAAKMNAFSGSGVMDQSQIYKADRVDDFGEYSWT